MSFMVNAKTKQIDPANFNIEAAEAQLKAKFRSFRVIIDNIDLTDIKTSEYEDYWYLKDQLASALYNDNQRIVIIGFIDRNDATLFKLTYGELLD